jgi:hypothetical protein
MSSKVAVAGSAAGNFLNSSAAGSSRVRPSGRASKMDKEKKKENQHVE